MAGLVTFVHVRDEAGRNRVFGPDDNVPSWAASLITNPKARAIALEPDEYEPEAGIPPKAGAGSSTDAWAAYAKSKGFEMDGDASRADIISALEAEHIPTE